MTVPAHPYWSLHTHSRYSFNDAMPQVPALVSKAVALGYPALGLTDHGNVSGTVQLYKACRKAGIEPLPGIELYITPERGDKVQANMHLTVAAYSERGYRNLVGLNNLSIDNFHFKPRVDLADLASLADAGKLGGLVVGTGCYFGVVQQVLVRRGERAALQLVRSLAQWFPRCYVELHNHGVPRPAGEASEDEIVDALLGIAGALGLPFLIASDAHYLEAADQPAHNALKEMVSFSEDPSEAVFPGGPYSLPDAAALKRFYDPALIESANACLAELATVAHVRLPELESFQLKVPDVTYGGDPDKVLEGLIEQASGTFYSKIDGELVPIADQVRYVERIAEELDVVQASGMAGYLLLVHKVCAFMLERGIWFHTRGSATGSLVNYLLCITQHDPLRWGLRMDRFMSRDRTRPPDIDLDVEHARRDEVIAMLEQEFSVRQVGNHMQYKIREDEDPNGESEGKGSLMVKFQAVLRKKGKPAGGWEHMTRHEKDLLLDLAQRKLMSGNATHAAGYIVAPDEASVRDLPLAYIASRKARVTAFAKKDVEALGYCKLDLLGLKTKTAVRIAVEAIHARLVAEGSIDPSGTPMEWYAAIPENNKATYARIGRGQTEGVFQLSGRAMQRGCRDLKPRNVNDLVAAQALFRPAMFAGKLDQTYLRRRRGDEPVPERHDDIQAVTADTYGIALYQEQVIDLCRRIGMDAEELTDTLDAVKASNDNVVEAAVYLDKIKGRVHELATARGWSIEDVDWLVDSLAGYADYSFNKAHSVSYGVEAYRSAYLSTNFPLEFWAGVLTAYANSKLEPMHVRNARHYKVRVRPPHVNYSGVTYQIDDDAIRKGLLSVKGVGQVAATLIAAGAPYASLADLGERVPTKVGGARALALKKHPAECGGVITYLYEADALEGLS